MAGALEPESKERLLEPNPRSAMSDRLLPPTSTLDAAAGRGTGGGGPELVPDASRGVDMRPGPGDALGESDTGVPRPLLTPLAVSMDCSCGVCMKVDSVGAG